MEKERIKTEIEKIQARNQKVEADKAWETSVFRRILIAIMTYTVTAFAFYMIGAKNPFQNALIPTIGYFLSTLSIPVIKDWWIARRK